MIVDVHTHILTHSDGLPNGEELASTMIRPDKRMVLTGSFEAYPGAIRQTPHFFEESRAQSLELSYEG